jgi:hypothetical protein
VGYEGHFKYFSEQSKAGVDKLHNEMYSDRVLELLVIEVELEFVRLNNLLLPDKRLPVDRLLIRRAICRVRGHYCDPLHAVMIMVGSFATYHGLDQASPLSTVRASSNVDASGWYLPTRELCGRSSASRRTKKRTI